MSYLRQVWTLAKKEMKDAFSSPLVYVLCGLFTLIIGWLFFNYLIQSKQMTSTTMSQTVIAPIFGNINFIFIFLAPLLTMRSFAEERKTYTLDLLLRPDRW